MADNVKLKGQTKVDSSVARRVAIYYLQIPANYRFPFGSYLLFAKKKRTICCFFFLCAQDGFIIVWEFK